MRELWHNETDEGENGGFWQGYYGNAVGAGEKFLVPGRGIHPEWYLFRLPIIDCYLTNNALNRVSYFYYPVDTLKKYIYYQILIGVLAQHN